VSSDRAFAGPTAVGRYWVAHAEGFLVTSPSGRTLGVVEEVRLDPRTSERLLVVDRSALVRRRAIVPAQRVASVFPWSGRLVLSRRSRSAPRLRVAGVSARMVRAAAWAGPRASTSGVAAWRLVRSASLWLRANVPPAASAAWTTAGRAAREARKRLPVLSGAWARRSRSGA
jgi:hypothetical protein